MGSPQLRDQFPLQTDWHETVYAMRMAGKHTSEIGAVTGKTRGGIDKVIAKYRDRGIKFPEVIGSPMAGIKAADWPNSIHMQHVTGTMPNGNRRSCHSQILADAIRGIECDGGALDG